MIISRKPEGKSVKIIVGEVILQQVHKYIYLGTKISEEAKSDKEIEKRSNIAKERFSKMAGLLTSRKLKIATKIRIVKCYVYSLFCY